MELSALSALFPIVHELIKKSPQIKNWIEEKAKKDDAAFLLQLQQLQSTQELKESMRNLGQGIIGLREYVLITSIMGAMLSNPELKPDQIKQKFITSVEVGRDILKTIKDIGP